MNTTLTSRLKDLILSIKRNPNQTFGYNVYLPHDLLSEMKLYLSQIAAKEKQYADILHYEIVEHGIEDILKPALARLQLVGYTYEQYPEIVRDCLRALLMYTVQNYPVHVIWMPVRSGTSSREESIQKLVDTLNLTSYSYATPIWELKYGVENALINWNGEKWSITALGELFISLSIPSGTVLLLLIELYLHSPSTITPHSLNQWHMSKEFLQAVLDAECFTVDIGDEKYSFMELDYKMSYLNRLDILQLTSTIDRTLERRPQDGEFGDIPTFYIADDFFEVSLTDFGRDIVTKVMDEEHNPLRFLIPDLLAFELSGIKYYDAKDERILTEIAKLSDSASEVIQDQKPAIEAILKDVREHRASISTLRTLPPTIEKLCKNILIQSNILSPGDDKAMFNEIIDRLKKLTKSSSVLKEDTLQYLHSIDRNKILHANITPTDEILNVYISLCLNVLLRVLQDYTEYKSR